MILQIVNLLGTYYLPTPDVGDIDHSKVCNFEAFELSRFRGSRSWRFHYSPSRSEVGAATKHLKPLRATPLHWLIVAAIATSATFSKSRNRYALLRYSATATTVPHPIKDSEKEEAAGRRDSRPTLS